MADQTQIQGVPPGVTLEPVPQSSAQSNISGVPPGVTLEPVSSTSSAASQPGAYQTKPGGPIQNANNPPGPYDRQADVTGYQTALEAAGGTTPGGQAIVGAVKGAFKTGLGLATLAAHGAHALGIHTDETDALARGDVSPFSEAMSTPTNPEQHIGDFGEGVAEWIGGEEALKGLSVGAKLAKMKKVADFVEEFPRIAKLLKIGANVTKSAALGGTQGGIKGAAEGDAVAGAEGGAAGGAIGAGIAEVAGPGIKALARIFGLGGLTGEEAMVKAGRPGVAEMQYRQALKTAAPRIVEAAKETPLKTVGDFEDLLHNTAQDIRQKEFGPMIQRNAKQMVSAQPVAANIRAAITDQMKEYAPEEAKELEDFAVKFAKDMPLGKAESDLQYFNAQLRKFYKAAYTDQTAALKTSGTVAKYEAAADGLRDLIYGRLRELGENAPEDLQKQYGALKTLERTFGKRATVADRQAPLNLQQVLSLAGGALEGGSMILAGHPLVAAAGVLPFAVSTAAKLRNAPESLIRQGVKAFGKELTPQIGESLSTRAAKLGAGFTGAQAGQWVRVQTSDKKMYEVHPEDLAELQRRDPGAKILDQPKP